jgi:hypothetical protein
MTACLVRCYSGHTFADEPRSFVWQGDEYAATLVEERRRVLQSATGMVTTTFAVTTEQGRRFCLSYDEEQDTWSVEAM